MDDRIDGKALHKPAELFRRKRPKLLGITGPGKVTAFHSFVKKKETVTFPQKSFDFGSRSSAEKEQGVWDKQVHVKSVFNDRCQGINSIPEICAAADDVDACKVTGIGIFKHDAPP